MGAVFKHIPDYFPSEVGVVGVIGGRGGFLCPMLFGALLQRTCLWTTCGMFFGVRSLVSRAWMRVVIQRMPREAAPGVARRIEQAHA
jgi:NNP family nitrate/nitrite transporter-like MFS transporter